MSTPETITFTREEAIVALRAATQLAKAKVPLRLGLKIRSIMRPLKALVGEYEEAREAYLRATCELDEDGTAYRLQPEHREELLAMLRETVELVLPSGPVAVEALPEDLEIESAVLIDMGPLLVAGDEPSDEAELPVS